jgi:hypothetical protein
MLLELHPEALEELETAVAKPAQFREPGPESFPNWLKRRRKHRPRGRFRFDTLDRSFVVAGKVLTFNLGWVFREGNMDDAGGSVLGVVVGLAIVLGYLHGGRASRLGRL